MKPQILILGGSFAGLNGAFDLKRKLKNRAVITVMDLACAQLAQTQRHQF